MKKDLLHIECVERRQMIWQKKSNVLIMEQNVGSKAKLERIEKRFSESGNWNLNIFFIRRKDQFESFPHDRRHIFERFGF